METIRSRRGRPEDSDPWLRVTAIDAKRGDGRYWTPDSENTGLVNRFGHAAFMLRQELYVFGGEATDASRATLGRTDCGAVSGRGLTWRPNHPKDVGPAARSWAGHGVVAGMRERPVGLVHGGRGGDGKLFDDTWVLDPAESPAWAKLMTVGGKPPARFFHSLAPVGENARAAVVAGGMIRDREGTYVHANDDMWILDMTPAFIYSTPKPPEPEPGSPPRRGGRAGRTRRPPRAKKGSESKVSKKKAPEPKKEKVVEKKPVAEVERKREPADAPDGASYEGQFVAGLRSGHGRMTYAGDGGVYDGEWLDDLARRGRVRAPARAFGEVEYEGEWFRGNRHGRARSTYDDGATFVGEYRDDHRHSHAAPRERRRLRGPVRALRRDGDGTCDYHDTARYEGQWKDDLRHGDGSQVASGAKCAASGTGPAQRHGRLPLRVAGPLRRQYDGEWKDDERHGAGVHVDDNGRYDGDWVKDREQGRGTWVGIGRPDHEKEYDGDWKAGGRHGAGASKYLDASHFDGQFRDDGRFHGTLCFANGDVYVGDFRDHKRHGGGRQT
ncbi:hypothetical protein JL721_12822 [Aureococcus anophagefferens]|nr:hypothetical protein JL721_12822 [Aureococcus anophagefferens]